MIKQLNIIENRVVFLQTRAQQLLTVKTIWRVPQ